MAQTSDPTTMNTAPSMVQLSTDPDFHFEILRNLSAGSYGGTDVGEMLTAAALLKPGNFESFYSVFFNMATRIYATAQSIDASRFPVSVRDAMFRAATYFRSADFYLHGNPADPRIITLWDQQATAFNIAISLMPAPGKRVVVKGAGFDVPCIWYPAQKEVICRPTIIVGGGYDGGMEELYHQMGKGAVERGYNVITYEGPGQATPRREQGLGFIVEWENVVTPIVDYLSTLSEVDMCSIALVGFSFGGFLAARAAAFEHRLAAVAFIDGLYDFGAIFLAQFPPAIVALYTSGNQAGFDTAMSAVRLDPNGPTKSRWFIDQSLWAFNTTSPFDWLKQVQAYTLKGITDQIQGPAFVAQAQNDMFYSDQAQSLATMLGNRSTFHEFATTDGAGEHCAIGAMVQQNEVVLDWFQDRFDGLPLPAVV